MQWIVRSWLVAFTTLAVAQPCPVVFEARAVITVSDVAYAEFTGGDAAGFNDFVARPPWACSIHGGVPRNFRGLPT